MADAIEQHFGLLRNGATNRTRLALAFVTLIASGAAGLWYALEPSGFVGLIGYIAGLLIACSALWPISAGLSDRGIRDPASAKQSYEEELPTEVQCEVAPPPKVVRRRPKPNQSVFDFDGMGALRARDSIDGVWLVSEATLEVIETVRAACRAAAPENGRMDRWFEIVVALNTARHTRDEKAEARRTQIAMTHGVSEEQTRQIDQGRYGPLNRIIAQIDPSEL
ncbi:MAG: hypothetical protein AAFY56_11070 [Pseudomonadota bacterium]